MEVTHAFTHEQHKALGERGWTVVPVYGDTLQVLGKEIVIFAVNSSKEVVVHPPGLSAQVGVRANSPFINESFFAGMGGTEKDSY